ncbi:pre-rRNA 2'-O-ribose RNA methyltransferase FTSJ3 [Pseudolycoriella hygida]|uniref:Putative rRNA methyltransferase n=1 Tax=Pseudolycoriella hygida TaxID=35572 RepID=A0A9Q0S5C4_9DIPT|nr:pre-rRNA 2'-O-ribose RNA methyltransferase FTSJ3 [Pseudolycoriella hygida]
MGKKGKIGKDRKDKFYKLAKETGFRSRAAFKLIQLNRKFGFLQQSRVCIDLCAAPGGWMQVAKENMPVSSIVLGVDLYPIRPIAGCISLTEDITTEKCKQAIAKELQTWKADVVLHDGAPNVGKNWLYDAHQQVCLTLNAVKLATNFLRGGGWFITKVFRSKDYNALMWVLKQLFKKVHATKPSASRKESAEIFVVCQYYIAPEKIDPKFLDAKYVFEELDLESTQQASVLHPEKKRIKAEGYSENDFSMRHELPVSAFIQHTSGLTALQGVGQIVFDDDTILNHVRTTPEIIECCKDIKVLGRKDMRSLLNWWKHLRAEKFPPKEKITIAEAEPKKPELTKEEIEEMEFEELEKHIAEIEMEDAKDVKRKRKKVQKARQKLNEKLNLKMVIKGDSGPQEEDHEVFSLTQIHSMAELDDLQDQEPDTILEEEQSDDEFKPKYKKYGKGDFHLDDEGKYAGDSDSDSERDSGNDSDDSENLGVMGLGLGKEEDRRDSKKKLKVKKVEKKSENPLLTNLDSRDKDTKRNQRVQLWFSKDNLKNVDGEADEDFDLDKLTNQYKDRGVRVLGEEAPTMPLGKKAKRRARHGPKEEDEDSDSDSDSDLDATEHETVDKVGGEHGYEVVSSEQKQKKIKLNEEELALGALMVQSQKTKRDLIDSAWNRYTFNDDNLPEWFKQDEMVHMRKEAPVTKELVDEYRKKMEELNVRPIKKVMEAKARKKRRALKRFEKAKKKAEAVLESADSSAQEKMRQIKKLYKKAQDEKKNEVTYVVTRKHLASKRVRRPAGVKGRFKVVDPRMKKDKRAAAAKEKTKGRRKK